MQQSIDLVSLLQWQVAMGVNEAIDHSPHNWLQPAEPEPAIVQPIRQTVAPISTPTPAVTASLAQTIAEAEQCAASAQTLEALQQAVTSFNGCGLKKTARSTVFADGNPDSEIMLIGEAPGADEDRNGVPFCGAAGQLLDKMLASIGLSRAQNCYLTNSIFWRPPGNRPPSAEETAICLPFVKRHIALFKPKLIIIAGSTPAKALLEESRGITRLRAQALSYEDIPVRVIFHPAYLLREPSQKRLAWQDLLAIQTLYDTLMSA